MRIAKNIFLGLVFAVIFTPVLGFIFVLIAASVAYGACVKALRFVFGPCEE